MDQISSEVVRSWNEEHGERSERNKEAVIAKYGQIFDPNNLDELTKEEFKSFLLFKNNRHWKAIHRYGNIITEDMDELRAALNLLLNEEEDIVERLNAVVEKDGTHYIKGLGRATVTPILLVVYPDRYGVYSTRSEESLEELGLLPEFESGASFGERYYQVNQVLNQLSEEYDISLWSLDAILGRWAKEDPVWEEGEEDEDIRELAQDKGIEDLQDFGMEKHLEHFLIANWERTSLGQSYELIVEDGDIISQQYRTDIGKIDILARAKENGDWIVIELKKGRSSDRVIGQISRYMGWVNSELAEEGENVRGLIVVGEEDQKLEYGLQLQDRIEALIYNIEFRLSDYEGATSTA